MSNEKIIFTQLFTNRELLQAKFIVAQVFNNTEDTVLASNCKRFIKQITQEQRQYIKNYPDCNNDYPDITAVFNPKKSPNFPAPTEEMVLAVKGWIDEFLEDDCE